MHGYRFELITGPMGSGKTEELIRRLKRAEIANKKVKVFFPAMDTRPAGAKIESRNGAHRNAVKIYKADEIMSFVKEKDQVIGIDELQFFDINIIDVIQQLIALNKKIIGSGLDLDFKSEPFGCIPQIYCYADKIDKQTAICMKCGSEYGNRTQRLINGEPADKNSPLIMIGGDESYEARCIDCYQLRDSARELENELCYSSLLNSK